MTYQIIIDDQYPIELQTSDATELNAILQPNGSYHVLDQNTAYQVKVLDFDANAKQVSLEVNGNPYNVQIKDEFDQLVQKMGLNIQQFQKMTDIKAPMPGLVLDIMVEAGQSVEKGDPLVILEAMKMENVLKAEGEGIVKSVEIQKGQPVDKGQIMIEME